MDLDLSSFVNMAYLGRKSDRVYSVEYERVSCPRPELKLALFLRRFDEELSGVVEGLPESEALGIHCGDRVRVIYAFEDFPATVMLIRSYPMDELEADEFTS